MGTILAGKIIDDVSSDMFDTGTERRYEEATLLSFLSDGETTIVTLKPSENPEVIPFQLVEGIYQSIPSSMETIIRPIRNMGTDGSTPGSIIKTVDFDHFTNMNPAWVDATPSDVVRLLMFDSENPYGFFCYPAQPSSPGYISALGSVIPEVISDRQTPIKLKDSNSVHLYHYCLYRCYKIMQSPTAKAESMRYWNLFVTGIGRKDLLDKEYTPNRDRKKLQRSTTDAN